MKSIIPVLLFCITVPQLFAQSFKGDVIGHVVDGKTQEPLPAVNVQVVEQPTFGAVTDSSGTFSIGGIPVGTYSLKATLVGYESIILTNIVVSTGRSTKFTIKLHEQAVAVSGITVQANYFDRNNQLAPLSVNNYDRAEVKRQPGSVMDVQRVVQNLPGIASSNDNVNELIVRGGAPYENLTLMEDMEIPSINHYPNEFNSAGPINMVNIDLVEDVQFSAGGFPAQYGDKISSVMDITIREGDRNKGFASNTGFNMAGIGTLMEGRIADGSGSWIFSARQSLLEFVDQLIGMSALSLTAIPKYWDAQTKVVYDLSPTQKLILNGIYGDSRIYFKGDPKETNPQRAGTTDYTSLDNVDVHNKQYVLGVNLKTLWGKEGYSLLSLYTVGNQYNTDVQENFTKRTYGPSGNVLSYEQLNSRNIFNEHNDEAFYSLKYDLFYQIHPRHDLMAGVQFQTANHWLGTASYARDTRRYFLPTPGNGTLDTIIVSLPNGNIQNNIRFGDASKWYTYLSDKYHLLPQLNLTLGLRYDYFTYSKQGQFSPRGSLSYEIIPPTTTVSLSAGDYWQVQPLPYYADPLNSGINKELPSERAQHIVFGVQHILDEGIKASLEAYYKKFSNVAMNQQFIHSIVDETYRSDTTLAVGKRQSFGLEFFIQKKQVTNYYGTLSVSLSKTEEEDPRIGHEGKTYPSQFDYPVIINLVAGKIVKDIRSWFNDQPFFIKYPAYILPFSDEMEISCKYRYQTGGPYTPNVWTTREQTWEGGVQWSRGAWKSSDQINSVRYPDYSRLDIQWISRFYMQHWNINVYIALMNVCNTKNVFYYEYRTDGTRETVYQFTFFPVGGIEIEF